jgi:hypothetical protein
LSQYDTVAAMETTGTTPPFTTTPFGPASVQKASATTDTTSSLFTLGITGFDVTGTTTSGPKQQYFAEFNVTAPLHWLGPACWSAAKEVELVKVDPVTGKPVDVHGALTTDKTKYLPEPKEGRPVFDSNGKPQTRPLTDSHGNVVHDDQIYPLAGRCWFWFDPRIGSVPTTANTTIGSVTASSIAGGTGQSIASMVQSFEFHGGAEFYLIKPYQGAPFGSGENWAKTTVSLIWGAGFTTPLNATTGSPEYGLSNNLGLQFNQIPTLPTLYPQLALALCSYGFAGSINVTCPNPLPTTKPTTVAFVFPNRSRFYRDFFAGFRLRTFFFTGNCRSLSAAEIDAGGGPNASGTNKSCTPNNTFPGTFDIRFGEDESVTAGHLVPIVTTLTGSYPLPGTSGALRIFGAWYLRLHRNQNSTTLVLIPTATFTTLDTSSVVVQPIQPSDQDYYRLGVGVDLVALIHKWWSTQQTKKKTTTGAAGSDASPTGASSENQ